MKVQTTWTITTTIMAPTSIVVQIMVAVVIPEKTADPSVHARKKTKDVDCPKNWTQVQSKKKNMTGITVIKATVVLVIIMVIIIVPHITTPPHLGCRNKTHSQEITFWTLNYGD